MASITPGQLIERFSALLPNAAPRAAAAILGAFEQRDVSAGSKLATQGEPSDELNLVCEGRLRRSWKHGDVSIALPELERGQWTGAVSVLDPGPALADVVADTDSVVLALSSGGLTKLRDAEPGAAHVLVTGLAEVLASQVRHADTPLLHARTSGAGFRIMPEPAPTGKRANWLAIALSRLLGGTTP